MLSRIEEQNRAQIADWRWRLKTGAKITGKRECRFKLHWEIVGPPYERLLSKQTTEMTTEQILNWFLKVSHF